MTFPDPEEIEEQDMTTEEVLEQHTVGPESEGTSEVVWHEEWEENPETRPGENARIVNDARGRALAFDYRDVEVRITNEGFCDWRVEFEVPDSLVQYIHGPGGIEHRLKSAYNFGIGDDPLGYFESIERHKVEGEVEKGSPYESATIVARSADTHQPTVAAKSFVDDLHENVEETERFKEDMEAALDAAKSNEGETTDDGEDAESA